MYSRKDTVERFDPELWQAIEKENQRQEDHLELIASENYASPRVLQALWHNDVTPKGRHFWQQPFVLPLDHRVALAYLRFQLRPVEHGNVAAPVLDQPSRLELACGFGDAFAAYPQHVGEQLVRHRHHVGGQPIEAQ